MSEVGSEEIVEIPRYEEPNPFNYTNLQLAKRRKDITSACKDFPTVPRMWVEWMYDLTENMPKEEVEKIINEKLWEKEPDKKHDFGGTIKSFIID